VYIYTYTTLQFCTYRNVFEHGQNHPSNASKPKRMKRQMRDKDKTLTTKLKARIAKDATRQLQVT
jgi:hypothetical protein